MAKKAEIKLFSVSEKDVPPIAKKELKYIVDEEAGYFKERDAGLTNEEIYKIAINDKESIQNMINDFKSDYQMEKNSGSSEKELKETMDIINDFESLKNKIDGKNDVDKTSIMSEKQEQYKKAIEGYDRLLKNQEG